MKLSTDFQIRSQQIESMIVGVKDIFSTTPNLTIQDRPSSKSLIINGINVFMRDDIKRLRKLGLRFESVIGLGIHASVRVSYE